MGWLQETLTSPISLQYKPVIDALSNYLREFGNF